LIGSPLASSQLTFLKDSITVLHYHQSDSLRIKSMVDTVISIDSICFTWKKDYMTQKELIGMSFDTVNDVGKSAHCGAFDLAKQKPHSDTSFYYAFEDKNRILIKPRKTILLANFAFGRCLFCAGVAIGKTASGNFSIKTVFVNNKKGRDTVYFVGAISDLYSSGVRGDIAVVPRREEEKFSTGQAFLASGRRMPTVRNTAVVKKMPANAYFIESKKIPFDFFR
jgi:hypothetical protein